MEIYNKEKPIATFFLFSYNQEKYIEDACMAALAQTYSPLEIIFSDDCSSDHTFELIEKIVENYQGPHLIKLNRNEINLGLIGHVNKSFEISSGELMIMAAGDDVSMPDRVECSMETYARSGNKALVIHSSAIIINYLNEELGILVPSIIRKHMTLNELAVCESLYIGATAAVSPKLYKEFGPIIFKDAYEDLVIGFRASMKNSLVYINKPLVRYRVGVGMSSPLTVPIIDFSSKIAIRRKKLKIILAVFEQRLRDVECITGENVASSLKAKLTLNISIQKKIIYFYQSPKDFLLSIFSFEFFLILRLLGFEMLHIVAPYWRLSMGMLRLRLQRLITARK